MSARRLPLTEMQLRMQLEASPVPPPPTTFYVRVNDFAWAITIPLAFVRSLARSLVRSFVRRRESQRWKHRAGKPLCRRRRKAGFARRKKCLWPFAALGVALPRQWSCNPQRKSRGALWNSLRWNSASWNEIVSAAFAKSRQTLENMKLDLDIAYM